MKPALATSVLPRTRMQKLAVALFVPLFLAWTTALLIPIPGQITEKLSAEQSFNIAKSLHVGVFAFETLLGLIWSRSYRERWYAAALVSFQGIATEIIQPYVGRHGCVQDVLIDHFGLGVGMLAFVSLRGRFVPDGEKVSGDSPV